MGRKLIGASVYWNLTISEYCQAFDIWKHHGVQQSIPVVVRPSRQEGKIVMHYDITDAAAMAYHLELMIDKGIPHTDNHVFIQYRTL